MCCCLIAKVMCNNGLYPASNYWEILTDHHEPDGQMR